MLFFILQQLFTRPYYHLFVAGLSQHCSRLTFALSLIYGAFLVDAVTSIISNILFTYLQHTNFFYQAFGFTQCRWKFLSHARSPQYHHLLDAYLATHNTTLQALFIGIRITLCLLALFMLWRLFMLVFQRCNGTLIKPVWAALITALIIALGFYNNQITIPYTPFTIISALWVLILVTLPDTTLKSIIPPTNATEKWLINPTRQAFSFSFTRPLSGLSFTLSLMSVLIIPTGIYLLLAAMAYFTIITNTTVGILDHLNSYICNIAALTPEAMIHLNPANYLAASSLTAFNVPTLLPLAVMQLLLPILPFLIAIYCYSLISCRLHSLTNRYAFIYATLICGLSLLINEVLEAHQHSYLANAYLILLLLTLALLKPKHTNIPN